MSDLIDRQAAIDGINNICPVDTEYDCTLLDRVDVRCVLSDLPSAQPERKKGEWIWCGNHHICSECDEWALTRWDEDKCDEVDILTDFCPNCGADMRGEENGCNTGI